MDDEETVTTKEAAMMLDTDMEQDMVSYGKEVTLHVVKFINRTPELYKLVQKGYTDDKDVTVDNTVQTCYDWAEAHNDEFGDLFQTELESVDWYEVVRKV